MLVSQELMKDCLPKLQALSMEMETEIQQSRQNTTED